MGTIYGIGLAGSSVGGTGSYEADVGYLFDRISLSLSPTLGVRGSFDGETVVPKVGVSLTGPAWFLGFPALSLFQGMDLQNNEYPTDVGVSFVAPAAFGLLGVPGAPGVAVALTQPDVLNRGLNWDLTLIQGGVVLGF